MSVGNLWSIVDLESQTHEQPEQLWCARLLWTAKRGGWDGEPDKYAGCDCTARIHAVVADNPTEDQVIVITVYEPDPRR